MSLNIKIYALLSFVACLYCSVKESNTKSDFEIFKTTYHENLNKKFEDDHSIYITLTCYNTVPRDIKKWNNTHVFHLNFWLVKEEVIEIDSSDSDCGRINELEYPERIQAIVPDEIMKKFYVKMKNKSSKFGSKTKFSGLESDSGTEYIVFVYLKREEAKILFEMTDKNNIDDMTIVIRKCLKTPFGIISRIFSSTTASILKIFRGIINIIIERLE